jgi:hypothetical protein
MAGMCSIGSCSNLNEADSHEGRQNSYYVFEQFAGITHLFQNTAKALNDAGNYVMNRGSELVEKFSSAPRIQKSLVERRKREMLGMAVAQGILLFTAGLIGGPANPSTALQLGKAGADLTASTYIGIVGSLNAGRAPVADVEQKLETTFRSSFNKLLHDSSQNVSDDLRDLMIGGKNNRGQDILDIIKTAEFLEPDPALYSQLRKEIERFIFATGVNSVWQFDRAYILDTDAHGGCSNDNRGPAEYRVCLPEFPNKSFWLYAIDPSQEGDHHKNDQAQVTGPTGFHAFDHEQEEYYNITREDIVRSSFFVHHNQVEDAIADLNLEQLASGTKRDGNLGKVPGAFSIPICRNPGGEAISSVWSDKARNYPCMCGEFQLGKWMVY